MMNQRLQAPMTTSPAHDDFVLRHIGSDAQDTAHMLASLGFPDTEALLQALLPAGIRSQTPLDLPPPATEAQALQELRSIASRNRRLKSFIGQGYYGTHTPAVLQRNVLENPAWYTAYTPYQAEISQGRLEALLNFQTMVCDLTSMPVANASMLDEATAAAEAMALARRASRSSSEVFVVHADVHPQTLEVLHTRAAPLGWRIVQAGSDSEFLAALQAPHFGALLQYPSSSGALSDWSAAAQHCHAQQALLVVATDLLALTLLTPPGEWGADIAVGSTQRLGMPMGAGGPHAAFMACQDAHKRNLPGRLVGVSLDNQGQPALRLALQTREQHIRREKATSNICTAQVLPAVMASMYAVYHGPQGLQAIAQRIAGLTDQLAAGLQQLGWTLRHSTSFDTLTVQAGEQARNIATRAELAGLNLRRLPGQQLGMALDETSTSADVQLLLRLFGATESTPAAPPALAPAPSRIPAALQRSSEYLTHPVFHAHRSETAMLRYLRSLSDKDLALDRCMIPLGSCTMKLNATSEMLPITWPEFADIHPFAPADQQQGYALLDQQLRQWLSRITGYADVSLQPNAGSQGEYAGLLAIRAWHHAQGQGHRDVCLIPSSAHGTNPASAQMCGMQVVVVPCDAQGNVDMVQLQTLCETHSARLSCIMITYPSTHGVFEDTVQTLCALVHQHGGRVYVDGANMNAMVALAAPGAFGGDVSHLNLHKTFCIPHGGGGPGVGPCAVKSHLAPFLPGKLGEDGPVGMVSAANFGSASILPISWMYIAMMGAAGLRRATQVALLNANYIAKRLAPHYKTLYTGRNGLVAHECILDVRPLEKTTGIGAEDVAKRLIDFGFHAPTLSFPVAGTLMVEPTESESQYELDRFCDAMIQIRQEIAAIEAGALDREDNPLKHAPHTAAAVSASEWTHAYPRELAAFPLPSLKLSKYWPPVARVDNVYGDKNIMCACIPVDAYKDDVEA